MSRLPGLVVVVEFEVASDLRSSFLSHLVQQAQNSLRLEPGCRHFDVCDERRNEGVILLYEIYDDDAAFAAHLESAHYRSFDETVRPLYETKTVRKFALQQGAS